MSTLETMRAIAAALGADPDSAEEDAKRVGAKQVENWLLLEAMWRSDPERFAEVRRGL